MECQIDGLKINYTDEGKGKALLFLHGWGSNLESFRCVTDQLKDSYRIIRLDFPGFGGSDCPPVPWNVDDYVAVTRKFIEYLALEKVNLIGHSFGGRVIIKMASSQNDFQIDKVVLMDSAGILPVKTLKKRVRTRVFKIGKRILLIPFVKKLFPDALEKYRRLFGSADYNNASGVLRDTMVRVVNEDLESYLPDIRYPVLLIWGDQDDATPMRDAHIMEKMIPDAGLVVIKGAGHFSFLKDPYLVAAAMKSFFG